MVHQRRLHKHTQKVLEVKEEMKVKDILKNGSIWIPGSEYENEEPIVSVVLPTYRRAESGLFEAAVQSVLNQTFKKIELIIIDDASTDGTFQLIQHFMEIDHRISFIQHSYNIGLPAISEYEGYMRARGQYIAFIFDDNEWQDDYLEKTVCYMEQCAIKASYGLVKSFYVQGSQDYNTLGNIDNDRLSLCDLNATNFIANSGVLLHRDVIETVGLYDPHILLTRLCDWDLWRRVMGEFRFEGTGIYASNEHGVKLNDSLGNTVRLNSWCSIEQMSKNRNNALLPQNFLEYDIFNIDEKSTELFLDNLLEFSKQYDQKVWFNSKDSSLEYIKKVDRNTVKIKRVIILTNTLDATTTFSFERIAKENQDIVFRFAKRNSILLDVFSYADACICLRNELVPEYLETCQKLRIPCYFYIDDNYLELVKDFKNDPNLKQISSALTNSSLKKYQGVFVSTKQLLNYFRDNKLHKNLILLEPIIEQKNINRPMLHDQKKIIIAFMGVFRTEIFNEIVLPALKMLSQEIKIQLYCPQNNEVRDISKFSNSNLSIEAIPYTNSLDLALFRFGDKHPDILVHCGPDIRNNMYKPENSLINAVQIGAVLVSSNEYPYKDQENEQQKFLLADNTVLSWYKTLKCVIETPGLREEIFNNAFNYCIKRYNGEEAKTIVYNELKYIHNIRYPEIILRYEEMYQDLYNQTTHSLHRSLTEVPLALSRLIQNQISYKIKCKVNNWSELGLCFASYGTCTGLVKVRISKEKKIIREVLRNIKDVEMNNWTNFKFNPIADSKNSTYTISLFFDYEPGSSLVGVFEDATKITIIYRILNKLGYHRKGMDILFTDCRGKC